MKSKKPVPPGRENEYYYRNRDKVLAKLQQTQSHRYPADYHLLANAKYRARKRGLPFNLELSDVAIPKTCPILGIPLAVNSGGPGPGSPTVDRINNDLGYVKGNVQIISARANRLKSSMTLADAKALLAYMQNQSSEP